MQLGSEGASRKPQGTARDSAIRPQRVSKWHIMASSRKLVWTHPCQDLVRELLIPIPPSVLVGVITSETFYDALFAQPFALALDAEISEARKIAHVVHKQREGHSACAQTRCYVALA